MTTVELNCQGLEFLFRLGFSLALSREEYDDYTRVLAGAEKTPVVASTSPRPAESCAPSEKAAEMQSMNKASLFTDVSVAVTLFTN